MYKVCLSHNQLKEYLMVLMDNDLLSYDVDTQKFKTTEKALRLIESYNQMVHLMDAPKFGYDSDEKFRQPFIYF